jgi:hypothetical protein
MYLKSPYPDLPVTPPANVHHFLWDRPEQIHWPGNFTFHIDAGTGERRTYREFQERTRLGATALGIPPSEGGLGLRGEDNEIVGIISRNSSVGAPHGTRVMMLTGLARILWSSFMHSS